MKYFLPSLSQWEQGPRIVAIGGGTGLSTMLRGLKKYTKNIVNYASVLLFVLDNRNIRIILIIISKQNNQLKLNFSKKFIIV